MTTRKLTKAYIDNLDAPDQDTFIWDETVPGFGLKVTPSGGKSFVIQYRDGRNRTKRLKISTPSLMAVEKARDEARKKLQQVREGGDPSQDKIDREKEPTVDEILTAWEKGYYNKKLVNAPSRRNADCEIRELRRWLGQLQVRNVTRTLLIDWHTKPEQSARPYQANRLIKRLMWVWEWSEINGYLRPPAPSSAMLFKKFDWYREERRARFFSVEEYRRLAESIHHHRAEGDLNPKHIAVLELLLVSGTRLREAMNLRYDRGGAPDTNYIDFEGGYIVLQRHKTYKKVGTKQIPITPEIRSILERCAEFRKDNNPHVFPADRHKHLRGPIKDPYDTFAKLLETAKIVENSRIHDLRRSLISFAINEAKISLDDTAKFIGHADPETTRLYYFRQGAERMADNMAKTTAALGSVINGSQ